MYVIDIKITEQTNETEAAERLAQHRAWFKKYFEAGNFLVVGHTLTANMQAWYWRRPKAAKP
ncbi:hypothetical protein K6121_11545 [Neisseria subflava]|uniref:hypothetical protein n=1 Tax=Neisseria subflava TaxID=28449 RepID=UPI001C99DDBD|nr:hypothetical protein [Neisseria subflava]MBY6286970.1 hypothetical protein [Neisseria subflava]